MQPDVLLLGERLVLAVERISEDVKHISAYMHDLSCSVSSYLNDKGKEGTSAAHCDERKNHPSSTPAAAQETSVENVHSFLFEPANVSSEPHVHKIENIYRSLEDDSCGRVDHNEDTHVLCTLTEGIKTEIQSEGEESGESCDMGNTFGSGEDNVKHIKDEPTDNSEDWLSSLGVNNSYATTSYKEDVDIKDETIEISEDWLSSLGENISDVTTSCKEVVGSITEETTICEEQVKAEGDVELCDTQDVEMSVQRELEVNKYLKRSFPFPPKSFLQQFEVEKKRKGPFSCESCGQSFRLFHRLQMHMRIHGGENPFQCTLCDKRCASKANLEIHMRIHSGERPYSCSVCQKTFNQSCALQTHMRVHTGQKPFQCALCDKAFQTKGNLLAHTRVHTGERPYKCSVCDKSFKTRRELTVHMRGHTGEKPFKCQVCERAFAASPNLTVHLRRHTGERPFACKDCECRFVSSSHLKKHRHRRHPVSSHTS